MELKGRHALVTGAGKRVGRAIAEKLLRAGVRLSAHFYRSASEASELAQLGKQKGAEVLPLPADLRDLAQIRHLVAAAEDRFGPVDVLVNSASDFFPTPALTVTEEQWDRFLDLNLKGQFFLAQACAAKMMIQGGVIINLGDVNGELPLPGFAPYVASKGGLLVLTKNLAKEWAPKIRVNAVSPGAVLMPEGYTEGQKQRAEQRSLFKRLGSPDDIAEAVLFLVGNDYMTGTNLRVDGGRSLG